MKTSLPDIEIRFDSKTFMTVRNGKLEVSGSDFQSDLVRITSLMGVLTTVLESALTAKEKSAASPEPSAPVRHDNVHYLTGTRR